MDAPRETAPPAWTYDEPEREWPGSEFLPDPREERLEELYAASRQKREDAE
jgi:hypothetical protein